jgi:ABC-type branched-subunit amino acid transport system substrate-binding protein
VVANDNKLGGTLGKYAVEKLNAKRIAVIDDRTAYGQGVAGEFAKGAKGARRFKIVDKQFTNDKATDFNAILTSIKGKNPGPRVLRRHGLGGRPAAAPDEGAGHQGQIHGWRRRLHRIAAAPVRFRRCRTSPAPKQAA